MGVNSTKESKAEYMREYRKRNPAKFHAIDLKKRFGIPMEEYIEMLEDQKGVCKICGHPETSVDHRTKRVRNLAVDHCHTTGIIRGLLCSACNTAIGLLRESPEILTSALVYLKGPIFSKGKNNGNSVS